MRVPLLLAPLLLLAGCWVGAPFYTASDARPALPAGLYRFQRPEDAASQIGRVRILPSGLTEVTDPGTGAAPSVIGFAPLDAEGRRYVAWAPKSAEAEETIPYTMLEKREGEYRLHLPFCESTATLAASAGAAVSEDSAIHLCTFPTRAALETAMRRFEPDQEQALRLIPVN